MPVLTRAIEAEGEAGAVTATVRRSRRDRYGDDYRSSGDF